MIRYAFKDGPLAIKNKAKADPQKIGEALAAVAAGAQGHLTPKAVVETARNPRHVLHKHFEWDDEAAANAFRLDQARTLIRSIHIVDTSRDESPPAFISIADKGGVSYRTLGDVLDSADLQAKVLLAAERDLEAFERRYQRLSDVCEIIREAREKIAAKRRNIENRAH